VGIIVSDAARPYGFAASFFYTSFFGVAVK
jgi:hypothetical protein